MSDDEYGNDISDTSYDQYEDEEHGNNQQHFIRRRKKPGDLAGAASGGGEPCCAHVVSPLVFFAILAGLAIVTYFLRQAITMNLGRKRRKRGSFPVANLLFVLTGNKIRIKQSLLKLLTIKLAVLSTRSYLPNGAKYRISNA